jgi:DNA-binding MarR family transcriptional regulator
MGRTIRQEKVAVLRESYYKITGNVTEAMLLNQMIYWAQRVTDFDKFICEENSRRAADGEDAINLTYGWIHKTATELKDEIMCDDSRVTIQRKIDNLVQKGYLERRNNPIHAYDRTYQYRVNILKIYDDLNALGYQLEGFKIDDDNTDTHDVQTIAQNEQCNKQAVQSNAQNEQWKEQGEQWNAHSVQAIPETTTEITAETIISAYETSSSSYSPTENKTPELPQNDDDYTKGEVSEFLKSIKIEKLEHKDMIAPMSSLIADLIHTGKVGQKRYTQTEIKNALGNLTAPGIDAVINRYTAAAANGEIRNPDSFIKSCLLSAGKAEGLAKLARKSGSDGIHCGNPSFNVDEYVKLSMMSLSYEQ